MKVAASGWVWLYLLVLVLARASQTLAQTSVLPQISTTSTSASQDLWRDGEQATHIVPDTKTTTAAVITPVSTAQPGQVTTASASDKPSVTPTPLSASTTQTPGHTFSSQPASSSADRTPSALFSAEPLLVSLTSASAPTTVQQRSQGIAGSTQQENPSQLNVGDEDIKASGHRPSSLDPLLAGLLSVFVVTTAVVFVFLFLRFRHQNSNPEFHRLQDLPMDDLMEDTPLSRYTY